MGAHLVAHEPPADFALDPAIRLANQRGINRNDNGAFNRRNLVSQNLHFAGTDFKARDLQVGWRVTLQPADTTVVARFPRKVETDESKHSVSYLGTVAGLHPLYPNRDRIFIQFHGVGVDAIVRLSLYTQNVYSEGLLADVVAEIC